MDVTFKWIGGATWILSIGGTKIACDPVLCPRGHVQDYGYFKTTRLDDPVYEPGDFEGVDLWLLTHAHEDHVDSYGVNAIGTESTIISHKSVKPLLKKGGFSKVTYLAWHDRASFTFGGVTLDIAAVPAVHARRKSFGARIGNGNGYFVQAACDGISFSAYVTGDSVYDAGLKSILRGRAIDVIIANAGSATIGKSLLSHVIGRITNNTRDLKKMIAALGPKTLIPVHWGTFSHYREKIDANSFIGHDGVKVMRPGDSVRLRQVRDPSNCIATE